MRTLWLAIVMLGAAQARAGDRQVDPVRVPAIVDLQNDKCPVGGEAVDGETSTDWNGVRVHLCCPGCIKKFRSKTAKYAPKLGIKLVKGKQGKIIVDLANARCPVMGGAAKERVFSDHGSVRMRHCCPGCGGRAGKDLAKTMAKLGYKYIPSVIDLRNKKCPVMGGAPDADKPVSTTHDGIFVRFCCPGCIDKFKSDPARYFAKLGVDPAKLKKRLN